jgi:NADPH:quinone reductase-like Zn-dependent oxidoreductase
VRAGLLSGFGKTAEVLQVKEMPDPEPGAGELLLEMLVAPVNPADLNIIEGKYGELPDLPAVIGNEGVGRVLALGSGTGGFSVGDLVLPMRRGTWAQKMVAGAQEAFRLPGNIDVT